MEVKAAQLSELTLDNVECGEMYERDAMGISLSVNPSNERQLKLAADSE